MNDYYNINNRLFTIAEQLFKNHKINCSFGLARLDDKYIRHFDKEHTERDKPIDYISLYDDKNNTYYSGFGFNSLVSSDELSFDRAILYQTYADNIYYVAVTHRAYTEYLSEQEAVCIFVPKGQVFKYIRSTKRHEQIKKVNAPILKDGLLDSIYDNSIGILRNYRSINEYGSKICRGMYFGGPPGTGKSMVCKWLCDLCSKYDINHVIVSSAKLLSAFEEDELQETVSGSGITIFDDIDLSFLSRKSDEGGDSRMACAFASALNNSSYNSHKGIIRIFTSNEPISMIDPAFKRPGRIDNFFQFEMPEAKEISAYFDLWKPNLVKEIGKDRLMKDSKGMSFADLDSLKTIIVTNKVMHGKCKWQEALEFFKAHQPKQNKSQYFGE